MVPDTASRLPLYRNKQNKKMEFVLQICNQRSHKCNTRNKISHQVKRLSGHFGCTRAGGRDCGGKRPSSSTQFVKKTTNTWESAARSTLLRRHSLVSASTGRQRCNMQRLNINIITGTSAASPKSNYISHEPLCCTTGLIWFQRFL